MKTCSLCAVAAAVALLAPLGVHAQDLRLSSEAELSRLLDSHQAGDRPRLVAIGGEVDESLATACRDPWHAGLEGGIEITLLNLYANHGAGQVNGGNGWFDVAPEAQGNLRYWFGYRGEGGLGLRARYWGYDSVMDDENFFDARLVDVEATASVHLCNWDLNGFAGVRWGDLRWSDEDGYPGYHFDGLGPTLGVDVRRGLFGNVALTAGVRGSALYGNVNELGNDHTAMNTAYFITEARLGIDYRRPMRYGGTLTLGVAWEHQLYSSLSGNVDNDIDPEDVDISLAGPVFRIGFER